MVTGELGMNELHKEILEKAANLLGVAITVKHAPELNSTYFFIGPDKYWISRSPWTLTLEAGMSGPPWLFEGVGSEGPDGADAVARRVAWLLQKWGRV